MFNRRLAAILFTTALFGQDLQSPEPKERIKAVRALKDGGSTAISSLTPLLSDPDREVRLETVRSTRLVPITRQAVMTLAVATLIPVSPLLLTVIPAEDLARHLLKLVM